MDIYGLHLKAKELGQKSDFVRDNLKQINRDRIDLFKRQHIDRVVYDFNESVLISAIPDLSNLDDFKKYETLNSLIPENLKKLNFEGSLRVIGNYSRIFFHSSSNNKHFNENKDNNFGCDYSVKNSIDLADTIKVVLGQNDILKDAYQIDCEKKKIHFYHQVANNHFDEVVDFYSKKLNNRFSSVKDFDFLFSKDKEHFLPLVNVANISFVKMDREDGHFEVKTFNSKNPKGLEERLERDFFLIE